MAYGGILTQSEILDEIDRNLGTRSSSEDSAGTRRLRHLNLASRRLAQEADWVDLRRERSITTAFTGNINTDAFVNFYSLIEAAYNEDLRHIYSVRIVENLSTDHKLIALLPRQWDLMFPDSRSGYSVASATSDITHYTLWNQFTAQLYKVPHKAISFRLRYTIWPSMWAADNSKKSEFSNKDQLLIAIATHSIFQSLGMHAEALQWFGTVNTLIAQARRDNDMQPDASRTAQPGLREQTEAIPGDYWLDPLVRETP